MNFQEFFQSNKFKWLLLGATGLIVALLIFQLAVFVGFHKARFSYQWGDNYHRMFGGPKGGFIVDFGGREFVNGHGIAGTIATIDPASLVIKGRDGVEKVVVVDKDSTIKKGTNDVKLTDLKIDEEIVVIGSPQEDGAVLAKIIRVFDLSNMPAPPPGNLRFNIPIWH